MRFTLFYLYIPLLISSCGDLENVDPQLDYSRAIQLEKGNYWVYETASIDLISDISKKELDDSTFIRQDTIIENKVFYIVENLFGLREIKTKLLESIIDVNNNIEFSATNFVDTLYLNSALSLYGMMKKDDGKITVPAGTFETVAFILFKKNIPGHSHNTDLNNPSVYNKNFSIHKKMWYAENVGVVKSVIYYANTTGFELRLKRYKINQ